MNIILFTEHFGRKTLTLNPHPLLTSIYALASHLRDNNHKVKTIALWRLEISEFEDLISKLSSDAVDVIGISTTLLYGLPMTSEDFLDFEKKVRILKNNFANAKILVGGSLLRYWQFKPLCTEEVLKCVDYFVKGQGESAFDAIIEEIETNKKVKTVSLSPKVVSDEIYKFENFNQSQLKYSDDDCIVSTDSLGIEYSRGCIFKCSFCNYPGIGKRPGEYIKTKDSLRDELIRNYEQYGTKYYYFTDDLLNESIEKVEELAEISSSLPFKLNYSAYIRLDLIHKWPKMADLLKDSGMLIGSAGIETINDASGKSVLKGLGKNRIDEVLQICKESWNGQVGLTANFILGLPHDTSETALDLQQWIENSVPKNLFIDINVNALRFSSEEMKNSSNYSFVVKNKEIVSWTNIYGYTFEQAETDATRVLDSFYSKFEVPVRFSGFELPQLLAYAEPQGNKDDMMQFFFNRKRSAFVNEPIDWYRQRLRWFLIRRKKYIESVLANVKF